MTARRSGDDAASAGARPAAEPDGHDALLWRAQAAEATAETVRDWLVNAIEGAGEDVAQDVPLDELFERINALVDRGAAARPAGDNTAPPVAAECFVPTLDGLIASVIHHDEPMPVVRDRAAERCASIAQHEADRRAAAGPRAGDTAAVSVSEHGEGEHVSDHADHGNARAGDTAPDDELRARAERQAAAYQRMRELGGGVGLLGEKHPDMFDDMLTWDDLTENRHAETVLALLDRLDRLRSEVAALRDAGDELAREVEERDTPYGPLAREVQAWRSAAGSPATAQPPAAVLRGLLAEARDLIDRHLGDRSQTARVLLRRIDAATTTTEREEC